MKLVRRFNHQMPETNDWLNHFMGRDFFVEPEQFFGCNHSKPMVNIKESDEAYNIEMAAPGYEKSDFQVAIENGLLTIKVEKEQDGNDENLRYSHYEFKFASFERSFKLPKGKADEGRIEASYVNGILSVSIPKLEEAKPKPKRLLEIL